MQFNITYAQLGARPPVTKPHPSFLEEVGEERLRELVSDHYELIKVSNIAHLFPIHDDVAFENAKKHSADFMIQISGGKPYFNESRGAPRMVGRHAPFKITPEARQKWLELYEVALSMLLEEDISEASIQSYWNYLDIFSIWMINTPSQS